MLKENELIGAIAIYRQEVRPFTDKQIELVQNFAAQAVIAIENTRLLNELRELLAAADRDLGSAQGYQSIACELKPVFQTMLENAANLRGQIWQSLVTARSIKVRARATMGVPAFPGSSKRNPIFQPRTEARPRAAPHGPKQYIAYRRYRSRARQHDPDLREAR